MAAFTDQVGAPATTSYAAVQRSFNPEVRDLGNLIGVAGEVVANTASLVNEIGTNSLAAQAQAEMTQTVKDSVLDPDYYNTYRELHNIPTSVVDSVIGKLKQQSIITKYLGEAGSSARRRAAVQQAAKNVFGATPTQSLVNTQDRIEVERRAQAASTLAADMKRFKEVYGLAGSNVDIMYQGAVMDRSVGAVNGANIGGKGSGGVPGSGVIRASLIPVFDNAKAEIYKHAFGPMLSMMRKYNTASQEEKAIIAASMGNRLTTLRADTIRKFYDEHGGIYLSPREMDYIFKPTEDVMKLVGTTLGLTMEGLTEEASLKKYEASQSLVYKALETSLYTEGLSIGVLRAILLAKKFGGDPLMSTLMDTIDKSIPIIKKIGDNSGRRTPDLVEKTLNYLVLGNKTKSNNAEDAMVAQILGTTIIQKTVVTDVLSAEIIERTLELTHNGDLHIGNVKNQDFIIGVMGGANGLAWIRHVNKTAPNAGKTAVKFFIETSNRGYNTAMEELAIEAAKLGVEVLTSDGKFTVAGDVPGDLIEYLDQANKTLTGTLKFKEFTTDAKTGDSDMRKRIIDRTFVPLMGQLKKKGEEGDAFRRHLKKDSTLRLPSDLLSTGEIPEKVDETRTIRFQKK
jgi:hypothetical protein